jgi:hypothetical protein
MKRLRTALGDEVESFEMENLEAALGHEMGCLGKDLRRQGVMQALTWPLEEAEVNKTVDSIRNLKDSLIMAMEVDHTYVAPATFASVLKLQIIGAWH